MDNSVYVGLDIGGTWIKGVVYHGSGQASLSAIVERIIRVEECRVASRLATGSHTEEFIRSLDELFAMLLRDGQKVEGIGVSTAGIVDYAGKNLLIAATHLGAVRSPEWKRHLENKYDAPVVMINDADAAAIGAACRGYLTGLHTIGIMPIGTGVGFTIWRNGRRWNSGKMLPLLGSVATPCGSFDTLGGVSEIAARAGHDLCAVFTDEKFREAKEKYISGLADIIYTACVIYHTDVILIGGGLAAAVEACQYPLDKNITTLIADRLALLGLAVEVRVMAEGNSLPLIGAVALAVGEGVARRRSLRKDYGKINTEIPYDPNVPLHDMPVKEVIELLWQAEQQAGENLAGSLSDISHAAGVVAHKLEQGGRLIYVGAGTSGRLAAIDNVELGCTFGFPRERVYTLIAGGVADAAIDIEDNFEEDASAVPEMLLASVCERDVVIGISVSGSAYYVRSAIAVAREFGAATIFIQESQVGDEPLAEINISMLSGHEVIAGSTRMKAGTATKKVLNFISTTAMILMGNVHGPYMIGVECINEKLIRRAQVILGHLFGMSEVEAQKLLSENGNDLRQTIEQI